MAKETTLPDQIGLFVLDNVILLPGNILPLQVFEKRYLNLIDHALANGRYFGIVQPRSVKKGRQDNDDLYETATIGKIIRFEEIMPERYLIMTKGIHRFKIDQHILSEHDYNIAQCDYHAYDDTREQQFTISDDDLQFLMNKINIYFHHQEQLYDHQFLSSLSHEGLVNMVAMLCVNGSAEKQALLEAKDIYSRFQSLYMLLQMAQEDIIGHA